MSYIASIRSDNYQEIESIFQAISSFETTIKRLSNSKYPITQIQADWAYSIVSSIRRLFSQVLRYRLSEEVVVTYLKKAALEFNRIYVRCLEYSCDLAKVAQGLYERVFALLPNGTNLQLELFGQGDYSGRMFETPILSTVRDWLVRVGEQAYRALVNRVPEVQGLQLELDIPTCIHPEVFTCGK